jgi:hypothetical protein
MAGLEKWLRVHAQKTSDYAFFAAVAMLFAGALG